MDVFTVVTSPRFDSQLLFKGQPSSKVENGFLVIRQRVNLYPFNGKEWWMVEKGQKISYECQPWKEEEWRNFMFVFRFICEHYWNQQHPVWLLPPATFTDLDVPFGRPTHRPNFQTAYEMDTRDFKRHPHADPHMTVNVMRLKDSSGDFRSYVARGRRQAVLSNRDIKETKHDNWWGPFMLDSHVQVTGIHENLHMLGGDHVGERLWYPECRKDQNETVCYGRDAEDRGELAGQGLRWVPAYANPWLNRIAIHTKTNSLYWHTSVKPLAPQPLSLPHQA